MRLIIYGDFNCPFSYLASQRVDRLASLGAVATEWRAVEHDPAMPLTGNRSEADRAALANELADVAALAAPGEHVPAAPPPVLSNTCAAVAAYAESVADGLAGWLRRRLFQAIWVEGRHIGSAYEVRRLVAEATWPVDDVRDRLASPDLPGLAHRHPDVARLVRLSGGTVAPDGGPLTTAGHQRIRQWRAAWQALADQTIPAVAAPDGALHPGIAGLRLLADLAGHAGAEPGPRPGGAPDDAPAAPG